MHFIVVSFDCDILSSSGREKRRCIGKEEAHYGVACLDLSVVMVVCVYILILHYVRNIILLFFDQISFFFVGVRVLLFVRSRSSWSEFCISMIYLFLMPALTLFLHKKLGPHVINNFNFVVIINFFAWHPAAGSFFF